MMHHPDFIKQLNTGLTRASIPDRATLIVAFSGGPDSSALLAGLSILSEKKCFNLIACHINHQIRLDSCERDQIAAKYIAESLGIEFSSTTVNVPKISKQQKISIETAARKIRYESLRELSEKYNAHGVVTGHTRDDQAETVLFHAGRGTGLKGLAGMDYRSTLRFPHSEIKLTVLRPLLDTSRSTIIDYCKQRGIQTVNDASNDDREYTRNKIRLDVLPALDVATPGAKSALARLAENASDDLEIVDWVVQRELKQAIYSNDKYSRSEINRLPIYLIRRILMQGYRNHVGHSQNLERAHVSTMASQLLSHSGSSMDLPNGVTFSVDKDSFSFSSEHNDDCPYPPPIVETNLNQFGITQLDGGFNVITEVKNRPHQLDTGNTWITYASPTVASLSLRLRNRKNGDRFQPLGMNTDVKLQDFFVGTGLPKRWRDRVPLIESNPGILWVVGSRLAEWGKVMPEHTKVTRLKLIPPL